MVDASSAARRFEVRSPHLNERQRRLVLAAKAAELGRGGVSALAVATGVARTTFQTGMRELEGETGEGLLTHVPTWDGLVAPLGRSDFLYVAGSKLCSSRATGHIASRGGRFVTVLPHGRREDKWFKDFIQTHAPAWEEAAQLPGLRQDDSKRIWRTSVAPILST